MGAVISVHLMRSVAIHFSRLNWISMRSTTWGTFFVLIYHSNNESIEPEDYFADNSEKSLVIFRFLKTKYQESTLILIIDVVVPIASAWIFPNANLSRGKFYSYCLRQGFKFHESALHFLLKGDLIIADFKFATWLIKVSNISVLSFWMQLGFY